MAQRLTSTRTSDEPFYHFFKMPPPRAVSLSPEAQFPRSTVDILGRGFDIIHPRNNKVFFQDTLRRMLQPARVVAAKVDPLAGLGVLTVEVPDLAGHGPVLVETPFGSTSSPPFTVAPRIARIVQQRSVVGARVRLFGLGIDLSPFQANIVEFNPGMTPSGTSTGVLATVVDGGIDPSGEEFLTVRVPAGIPPTGSMPVGVFVNRPSRPGSATAGFSLLHPTISLIRTTGLPSYATQSCAGVSVTLTGRDFPRDPFFDVGTTFVNLDEVAIGGVGPITTASLQNAGADTADIPPFTFTFPGLGPTHPGGNLILRAADSRESAAFATTPFRVPLTNIPIVFVPGTSGSSLDLSPTTSTPLMLGTPADEHTFPWICKTCRPPIPPDIPTIPPTWSGWLGHLPLPFSYNPGPSDPRGPRVWLGPEAINHIVAGTLAGNAGNHYLDAVAFSPAGVPVNPQIVPGTVFSAVSGGIFPTIPVYAPLINFLTNSSTVQPGALGRPLCTGSSGPCSDPTGAPVSGSNGLFLFNLDWRDSNPREASRLAAFIDSVLAFSGAPKVVIIAHSYGGPVTRSYYLNPANGAGAKVDQVISLASGFLGVIEPFKILEMGSTWGFGIGLGPISGGFAEWETKALAQNWPTAYFQMPSSETWFFNHVPGGVPDRTYVRDRRLLGSAGKIPTYRGSMAWLAGRPPEDGMARNGALIAQQDAFFNPPGGTPLEIGDFRSGTGSIYHHRVISRGRMDTIVAVEILNLPSAASLAPPLFGILDPVRATFEALPTGEHKFAVYGDGDSTVPFHGALGLVDMVNEDRVYIIDRVVHGDLPNIDPMLFIAGPPSVNGLLPSLLNGSVCSQPQIRQISNLFFSQNDVAENLGQSVIARSIAVSSRSEALSSEMTSWRIELRGPAAGLTIDNGRGGRMHWGGGLHDERLVENTMPGASFDKGPYQKTVLLTEPGNYRLSVSGKLPFTEFNLYISSFTDQGRGDTLLYRGIPLFAAGRAELVYQTGQTEVPRLRLNSRGGPDFEDVEPTVLSAQESADADPPTTKLTIRDGMVVAEASDNDNGSGVFRTWYIVEGETWRLYEGPFPVPSGGAAFSAFSEDLAGNLEYPGARLKLQ